MGPDWPLITAIVSRSILIAGGYTMSCAAAYEVFKVIVPDQYYEHGGLEWNRRDDRMAFAGLWPAVLAVNLVLFLGLIPMRIGSRVGRMGVGGAMAIHTRLKRSDIPTARALARKNIK